MELVVKHTAVFRKNWDALHNPDVRNIVNQGGSRSSKTYSLMQVLILYAIQNPKKVISIVRKSFPALAGSVMRDFFEVLDEMGIYDKEYHNKSSSTYKFPNGSYVEFFSVDDSQKLRGRKRHILLMNEANELDYEEFLQLNMRTVEKVFADFNPSDTEHWLYQLADRDDSVLLHSTYKDNPFLAKTIVKEIEELIKVDQDYYNIYALGLPAKNSHTVFNHHQTFEEVNEDQVQETIIGLDFGYTHPTAMVLGKWIENECYVQELIYESGMTTPELIIKMNGVFDRLELSKSTTIVCDYARPEIIEDLVRNGFNAVNAIKNVKEGIDAVKSTPLFVHKDSFNMLKEFRNYKWKVVKERITDEVVKLHDDAMDAMRYMILYHKRNTVSAGSWDFVTF